MGQLQEVARFLFAAGGAMHPEGKGMHLLYTQRSILTLKYWTGVVFGDQELITASIRTDSTASYLITSVLRLIFCISASSYIRALSFDEDEEEWVDREIPSLQVHPRGHLAATAGTDGQFGVFFQDPSCRLIHLDHAWRTTPLPSHAAPGSPISVLRTGNAVRVFYISEDRHLHQVSRHSDGRWSDERVSKCVFPDIPKRIVAGQRTYDRSTLEVYMLTEDNTMRLALQDGKMYDLGKVDCNGDLWARDTAVCCREVPLPMGKPERQNCTQKPKRAKLISLPTFSIKRRFTMNGTNAAACYV
ncbi:hypothetical protein WOLCODRAFT_141890 [Wolfiporia cocos MD-104 SS10]|uniref:Uncharacterized protein n=1 Tax=Wolfiporia cocos (strain MD-104) TaxID=742152 RepID=A0A2H3JDC6_WOLCO|nr:hypothetical protein WOLCODRAFT_141890 [Wolfiporia cocos MD-104 SS10]